MPSLVLSVCSSPRSDIVTEGICHSFMSDATFFSPICCMISVKFGYSSIWKKNLHFFFLQQWVVLGDSQFQKKINIIFFSVFLFIETLIPRPKTKYIISFFCICWNWNTDSSGLISGFLNAKAIDRTDVWNLRASCIEVKHCTLWSPLVYMVISFLCGAPSAAASP